MGVGIVTMMGAVGPDPDSLMEVKEVYWRPATPADVAKIGQPVCYNSDLAADYQERTANPIVLNAASNNTAQATTYAEGAQTYDARIFCVEQPALTNINQFAGAVVALGSEGGVDGDKIKIAVPTNAMVALLTDLNCVQGTTALAVTPGSTVFTTASDGASKVVAVAEETIDRSGTDGLVWGRIRPAGMVAEALQAHTAVATLLESESGSIHTNVGASGHITFTLPTGVASGVKFTFVIGATFNIVLDPGAASKIVLGNGADVLADTEVLTITPADANDHGALITIVSDGNGDWIPTAVFVSAVALLVIP